MAHSFSSPTACEQKTSSQQPRRQNQPHNENLPYRVDANTPLRKGCVFVYSRTHHYYQHKQPAKDWPTKQLIEAALRDHPSYGHKRLALHLKMNKKRTLRVMKLFGNQQPRGSTPGLLITPIPRGRAPGNWGIKPYRRTTPKLYQKPKDSVFPNYLMTEEPRGPGDIYASDFPYIKYQGRWLYVATVLDVFTREIVGVSILNTHATQLVMNALSSAVLHRAPPRIIHSDQGSEYASKDYTTLIQKLKIKQSMSAPGCPWVRTCRGHVCKTH